MIMRVARISSEALVVLALIIRAWTAPALPGERPTDLGAQHSTDRAGDPLPSAAAMRLGTVRYRQDERIERIAYTPDGRFVVTTNGKLGLQVWDARDGRKVRRLDLGGDDIRDFALSPDGKAVAAICSGLDRKKRMFVYRLIFIDFVAGSEITRIETGQTTGHRGEDCLAPASRDSASAPTPWRSAA
jgi:hypothetical protein